MDEQLEAESVEHLLAGEVRCYVCGVWRDSSQMVIDGTDMPCCRTSLSEYCDRQWADLLEKRARRRRGLLP